MSDRNPVLPQDRAEDLIECWRKYGYVMFPQQRRIYQLLASEIAKWPGHTAVLEAGCGSGLGAAWLERATSGVFTATDGLQVNVDFCRCLYPWINFELWDIGHPWDGQPADAVVCVECLEHVADPQAAVRNLLAAAKRGVWLSTPNGRGKPRPPSNPQHVQEYEVGEVNLMVGAVAGWRLAEVLGWEDFAPLGWDTDVDPLVYRIVKEQP